jgi:hypothetical protein
MVTGAIARRAICCGLVAVGGVAATGLRADDIAELDWQDLIPTGHASHLSNLQGLFPHDESAVAGSLPVSTGVRTDWNGQTVRLSGFIVPLDYSGKGVSLFILVPYVGACIHVPPPPANQLVLVSTTRPYETDGLFDAVTVTGMFGTAATSTQLADIAYALSADDITRYQR